MYIQYEGKKIKVENEQLLNAQSFGGSANKGYVKYKTPTGDVSLALSINQTKKK